VSGPPDKVLPHEVS